LKARNIALDYEEAFPIDFRLELQVATTLESGLMMSLSRLTSLDKRSLTASLNQFAFFT